MPTFEEFNRHARPTRTEPLVTIQSKGVFGLNPAAFEALGKPDQVVLLMAPEEQTMAFRVANESDMNAYRVRKPSAAARSYVVAGKAFCDHYGIPIDQTRTYLAQVQDNLLMVDLRQQPTK